MTGIIFEPCWLRNDDPWQTPRDRLGRPCRRQARETDWISFGIMLLCLALLVGVFIGWIVNYSRKASEFRTFWTSDDRPPGTGLELKPSFSSSASFSTQPRPALASLVTTTLPYANPPAVTLSPSSPTTRIVHSSSRSITSLATLDSAAHGMKKRSPLGSQLPTFAPFSRQSVTVTVSSTDSASLLGLAASRAGLWDARRSIAGVPDLQGGLVEVRQWGDRQLEDASAIRSPVAPILAVVTQPRRGSVVGDSVAGLSEAGRGWLVANAALASPAPDVAPDPQWGRQEGTLSAPTLPESMVDAASSGRRTGKGGLFRSPSQTSIGNYSRPGPRVSRPLSTRAEEPDEENDGEDDYDPIDAYLREDDGEDEDDDGDSPIDDYLQAVIGIRPTSSVESVASSAGSLEIASYYDRSASPTDPV